MRLVQQIYYRKMKQTAIMSVAFKVFGEAPEIKYCTDSIYIPIWILDLLSSDLGVGSIIFKSWICYIAHGSKSILQGDGNTVRNQTGWDFHSLQ